MSKIAPPTSPSYLLYMRSSLSANALKQTFSLQITKASTEREHTGIIQQHFLELLTHNKKYLEFLINSTCLGVNAKMHGLS